MTSEGSLRTRRNGLPRVVSLFSGAGGLDLGFRNAGFEVAFAVDNSKWAIKTHKRNFPETSAIAADLVELGPDGVLRNVMDLIDPGQAIGVIGGPPCQGFSRANTNSRADDPRNDLAFLYLDIVGILKSQYDVQFALFENVEGIRDAKHQSAFGSLLSRFAELGFHAEVQECAALDFGVPQTRRRVIVSAFSHRKAADAFEPLTIPRSDLTVKSAIGGLPPPAFYSRSLTPHEIPHHPNHWTMRPVSQRFSDPGGVQNGGRSFRRLSWDKPSPTVAYGHREIHVHPNGRRRLSIYEAMLLQGFPADFVLEGTLSAQVEQVSNAVPPPLARSLGEATRSALAYASEGGYQAGAPA